MQQRDKHLQAAWEAYTVMKDLEDLADTLVILCDVKREIQKQNTLSVRQVQQQPAQAEY